jgi:hypothetical protein
MEVLKNAKGSTATVLRSVESAGLYIEYTSVKLHQRERVAVTVNVRSTFLFGPQMIGAPVFSCWVLLNELRTGQCYRILPLGQSAAFRIIVAPLVDTPMGAYTVAIQVQGCQIILNQVVPMTCVQAEAPLDFLVEAA